MSLFLMPYTDMQKFFMTIWARDFTTIFSFFTLVPALLDFVNKIKWNFVQFFIVRKLSTYEIKGVKQVDQPFSIHRHIKMIDIRIWKRLAPLAGDVHVFSKVKHFQSINFFLLYPFSIQPFFLIPRSIYKINLYIKFQQKSGFVSLHRVMLCIFYTTNSIESGMFFSYFVSFVISNVLLI